jgi:uncharacterized protein YciI
MGARADRRFRAAEGSGAGAVPEAQGIFAAISHPVPGGGKGDRETAKAGHLAYKDRLEALGVMIASGPMTDPVTGAPLGRGLWILRAPSLAAARTVAEADPYVAAGYRTVEVHVWRMTPAAPAVALPGPEFWTDPGKPAA